MKTYLLLNKAGTEAQWRRLYNPDTEVPLSELYEPAFVARLIDVTGQTPAPQEGWVWDGQKFNPPPAPVIDPKVAICQQIADLKAQRADLIAQVVAGTAPVQRLIDLNQQISGLEAQV